MDYTKHTWNRHYLESLLLSRDSEYQIRVVFLHRVLLSAQLANKTQQNRLQRTKRGMWKPHQELHGDELN